MITEEQYKSTDTDHYHEISIFLCEQSSTAHTLKEIERITSKSEELNSFITIILSICDFSNFYFNLLEQFSFT